MKAQILVSIVLFSLSAAFIGWRVHATRNLKTNHAVLLIDHSLSHPDTCLSVAGLAERIVHMDTFASGSMLTALVLGDEGSANEPRRFAQYQIPRSNKAIEGRTANLRQQQELVQDIQERCEAIPRTMISPIFLGVKQAIAELRSLGCKEDFACVLYVGSDGEENMEQSIKHALRGSPGDGPSLPAPLNNKGIQTVFCGIAVTAGRVVDPSGREIRKLLPHDASRDDGLKNTWSSLFTEPALVSFEPYCPIPGRLTND